MTWGGAWTPAMDGCEPDFDHKDGRLADGTARVKLILGSLCAALAFGLLATSGAIAWAGTRCAATGKWVVAD